MLRITASDWTTAAISVAWYAAPDFIADRRRRNWAKAGLGVAGTSVLAWLERDEIRRMRDEVTASHDIAQRLDSGALTPDAPEVTAFLDNDDEPGPTPLLIAGVVATVTVILGSEVAFRRLAKRQEARGVRRPHLLGAVLRGALALGLGPATRLLERVDDTKR